MTPEDDYLASGGRICPWCGATDPSRCELEEDETSGVGVCPWEESKPDPDYLRDLRDDR